MTDVSQAITSDAFAEMIDELRRRVADAQRNCDAWAERFAKHPHNAFEWSNDIFQSAATLHVYGQWVVAADNTERKVPLTFATAEREAYDRVICGARNGCYRSTSMTSNRAEEAEVSAWAHLLEIVKHYRMYERRYVAEAALDLTPWQWSGKDREYTTFLEPVTRVRLTANITHRRQDGGGPKARYCTASICGVSLQAEIEPDGAAIEQRFASPEAAKSAVRVRLREIALAKMFPGLED